jgi:hypothetical protein
MPSILPAELIADYFEPQHLVVEGANPEEFFRSGKLPEGFYKFKFEVLEYHRGVTISNTAQSTAWLMLNDPPRIIFPSPNQKVNATNPQLINFSWAPSGISSPLSAISTMYEFTMVELNNDIDPNVAITTASDAIKFTRTLQQTNLVYGPGEPPLTLGKRYAFRVKAYNTQGYDLFKNNGYSDVRVFQFGDACNPPILFTLSGETQSTFTIEVQPAPGNTAWEAQLREEDDESGEWTILKPESGNTKTVKGLKPSTSYQVQLNAVCGPFTSDITQPQTITTKPRVNSNRECNNSVSPFVVQQAGPLSKLKPDDIFVAALMPIRVTQVTKQGSGKFSGKGIATLPFVSAGLAVTFDDIGINELWQLTSGEVKGVRDVTNATWFGDTPPPVPNTGGGSTGTATDSTGTWPPFTDTINIDVPFDTIIVVNDSTIMVVPQTGGEAITVNLGGSTCTLIVPPDGNLNNAQVVYNGAAKPYRTGQGSGNSTRQEQFNGFLAKFTPAPGMLYGFDTLRFEQLTSEYAEIKVNGKNVKMPWKALKAGATDVVELHIRRNPDTLSFDKLKVGVYNGANLAPSAGANTSKQTYTLTGTTDGDVQAIVASFADANGDTQYAGGLNTITYAQQDMNLIMVPLPGVNLSDAMVARIQVGLNEIYRQAVVEWTVTPLKGFPGIDLGDNGLDWADKEMLSAYNQEMNALIAAFKDWAEENGQTLNHDAFYLFVVPRFSESGLEGFMPLNHRFGFVAQEQVQLDDRNNLSAMHIARTVAHELGHGAFNLRHTFSEKNFVTLPQGTTGNLMDYPTTPALSDRYTALVKTQWDLIHNPQSTTGLFDGMEEGAILNFNMSKESIKNVIDLIRNANISNEQRTDLTGYDLSKGVAVNLELTSKFILDFIEIEITSGKNIGTKENPFLCEPLIINPMELKYENTTTPLGQEGNFIKVYYKRLDKVTPPAIGYAESGSLAIAFIIKESQKDEFEEYIHAIKTINLSSINWVSQFDEDIFGLCTGCWKSSCCRRACEYMMGNTNIANCTDSIIAYKPPYLPVFGRINLATFSDNTSLYNVSTYNAAALNFDPDKFAEAIRYMKDNLRNGLPVLIGTHYTNGISNPPNNSNRATRHFMVIVGMGMEGDKLYFRFYDPGRSVSNMFNATSPDNKLIINRQNSSIQGHYRNRTYTLTEIVKVN